MAARARKIPLKNIDATIQEAIAAVNAAKGSGLKGPILIGIVVRPEQLKGLNPAAVARQITSNVAASVPDVMLTPRRVPPIRPTVLGFVVRRPSVG
jgi:hypothetical protein